MRAAAYSALIEAEKITRQRGSFSSGIISADIDFNGAKEIMYQGADLNAYVQLRGACLAELDSFKTRTNYVNAMDLGGQGPRRLCFRDHLSEKGSFGAPPEDRGGFANARYSLVDAERPASVASLYREGEAEIAGRKRQLSIKKTYYFRKGGLSVEYEISNRDASPLSLRLGVDFNLAAGFSAELVALTGIRAREEIRLETARKSLEPDLNGLRLANLSKDEKIELRSDLPFHLMHAPILSNGNDGGSTSAYQGCVITLGWDLDIAADAARRFSITLELRS